MNNEDRYRYVAKIMSESSEEFRDAVASVAFGLNNLENLGPQQRLRLIEGLCSRLPDKFLAGAAENNIALTLEQAEDLAGAVMLSAMDMAVCFPVEGGRA